MRFRKRRLLLALGLLIGLLVGLPSLSYVVARRTADGLFEPLPEGWFLADARFVFWEMPTFEDRQLAWRFIYKHTDYNGDGVQLFVSPTGELLVTNPIDLPERIEEMMQSVAQARAFEPLAEDFVEAAAAGDTVALQSLCDNDRPVEWALRYLASEPQLFSEAAGQLKVRIGNRSGDIVVADFGFPYQGKRESLGIVFVLVGETWKIQHVQLTWRVPHQ
jgi:hypothetical protein